MPKCFLTGIEIDLQESWLLDRGAGKRAIMDLRQRLAAVERLVSQLSVVDEGAVFDRRSRTEVVRKQRRLICQSVAAALSASHPEFPLLVSWKTFSKRRTAAALRSAATAVGSPKENGDAVHSE